MKVFLVLIVAVAALGLSACGGKEEVNLAGDSPVQEDSGATGPESAPSDTTPDPPDQVKEPEESAPAAEGSPDQNSSKERPAKVTFADNPDAKRIFENNLRAFYGKDASQWCSTYSKNALSSLKKSTGLSCRKYVKKAFPRQKIVGIETAIYETSGASAKAIGLLCLRVSEKVAQKLNLSSRKIPSGSIWGTLLLEGSSWSLTSPPDEIFSGFDSREQDIIIALEKKLKKNVNCDWKDQVWTPSSGF